MKEKKWKNWTTLKLRVSVYQKTPWSKTCQDGLESRGCAHLLSQQHQSYNETTEQPACSYLRSSQTEALQLKTKIRGHFKQVGGAETQNTWSHNHVWRSRIRRVVLAAEPLAQPEKWGVLACTGLLSTALQCQKEKSPQSLVVKTSGGCSWHSS